MARTRAAAAAVAAAAAAAVAAAAATVAAAMVRTAEAGDCRLAHSKMYLPLKVSMPDPDFLVMSMCVYRQYRRCIFPSTPLGAVSPIIP